MIVKFHPTKNECCCCIDDQITRNICIDCAPCKEKHSGLLLGFVAKKKETYAVIHYNGKIIESPIECVEVIEE